MAEAQWVAAKSREDWVQETSANSTMPRVQLMPHSQQQQQQPPPHETNGATTTNGPTHHLDSHQPWWPFDVALQSPSMTFVSNLLADHDPDYTDGKSSFSAQLLLTRAMAMPSERSPASMPSSAFPLHFEPQTDLSMTTMMSSSPSSQFKLFNHGDKNPRDFSKKLPERRALGSARLKLMSPVVPQHSNYVTIPPGLSPGSLLDSPLLFGSRKHLQASPTTGSFPLPTFVSGNNGSSIGPSLDLKINEENPCDPHTDFVTRWFTHNAKIPSASFLANEGGGSSNEASLSEYIAVSSQEKDAISTSGKQESLSLSLNKAQMKEGMMKELGNKAREGSIEKVPPQYQQPRVALVVERPPEDGYGWRKYGQKQVKGSEYPRCYYKCTTSGCPVRKKVERSYDGQITEIVYRGAHNHPKPLILRRFSSGGGMALYSSQEGEDKAGLKGSILCSSSDILISSSKRGGTLDPSSMSVTEEEEDDEEEEEDGDDIISGAAYEEDENEDESYFQQRKEETLDRGANGFHKASREPPIVVQTTSEIDILDDGYRWRKYGQKVVKGNPYPRSYYRCTSGGCGVRKHVERSFSEPESVITTYGGKHNHDVPVAKSKSHNSSVVKVEEHHASNENMNLNNALSGVCGAMEHGNRETFKMEVGKDRATIHHLSNTRSQRLFNSGLSGAKHLDGNINSFGNDLTLHPKQEEQDYSNAYFVHSHSFSFS